MEDVCIIYTMGKHFKGKWMTFTILSSSWLYDEDGDAVKKVNARLGAVTQLDTSTAEGLQVGHNNVCLETSV